MGGQCAFWCHNIRVSLQDDLKIFSFSKPVSEKNRLANHLHEIGVYRFTGSYKVHRTEPTRPPITAFEAWSTLWGTLVPNFLWDS